jgi:hypothetical protein
MPSPKYLSFSSVQNEQRDIGPGQVSNPSINPAMSAILNPDYLAPNDKEMARIKVGANFWNQDGRAHLRLPVQSQGLKHTLLFRINC